MVFAIGQRVLPAFSGMRVLWSTRLMFWSLLLLFTGCFLRVAAEPLAYEHIWAPAWKILPISAIIELTAVSAFAVNLGVTLVLPPAHLRARPASSSGG
jgi:quinol-cytochrome oxidoreductase complex cytochrome b subunit